MYHKRIFLILSLFAAEVVGFIIPFSWLSGYVVFESMYCSEKSVALIIQSHVISI
jgi:hypothetical protein